jgi:hypothetical protein
MLKSCWMLLLLFASVPLSASEPKESDYPLDFYVQSSGISRTGDGFCWMRLQNGTTVYVVNRGVGMGKCFALNPNQHYRGKFRLKRTAIELLWYEGTKPKRQTYLIDQEILGQ